MLPLKAKNIELLYRCNKEGEPDGLNGSYFKIKLECAKENYIFIVPEDKVDDFGMEVMAQVDAYKG